MNKLNKIQILQKQLFYIERITQKEVNTYGYVVSSHLYNDLENIKKTCGGIRE